MRKKPLKNSPKKRKVTPRRRKHEQPLPTKGIGSEGVFPRVMEDLRQREQIGIATYGQSLHTHNGRNALLDAYEEALDLVLYLKQALMETEKVDLLDVIKDVPPFPNPLTARASSVKHEWLTDDLSKKGKDFEEPLGGRVSAREFLRAKVQTNSDLEEEVVLDEKPFSSSARPISGIDSAVEPVRQIGNSSGCFTRPGRVIPVNGQKQNFLQRIGGLFRQFDWFPIQFYGTGKIDLKKETVLEEAQRLVHGDRGESYGHPIFDLTRTADISTALLRTKLIPGQRLEPEDIAKIMVGVKLSRETHQPKRDNRVDVGGYIEVLDMILQWREKNPGKEPRDFYNEAVR